MFEPLSARMRYLENRRSYSIEIRVSIAEYSITVFASSTHSNGNGSTFFAGCRTLRFWKGALSPRMRYLENRRSCSIEIRVSIAEYVITVHFVHPLKMER